MMRKGRGKGRDGDERQDGMEREGGKPGIDLLEGSVIPIWEPRKIECKGPELLPNAGRDRMKKRGR